MAEYSWWTTVVNNIYITTIWAAIQKKLHILKDVVDEMKLSIHSSVTSSIHPSRHPSMDGITAAHVAKILL
jgi:hypothetical protein